MVTKCEDTSVFDFTKYEYVVNENKADKYVPTRGEYCWFYSHDRNDEWKVVPVLARFHFMLENGNYSVEEFDRVFFSNCEKFNGELPEFLRK